jgi:hypothetical protein
MKRLFRCSSPRRLLLASLGGLVCILVAACGQPASVAVPLSPASAPVRRVETTPTVDPLTLNICKTCDVQQRRVQATAAAN